MLLGVNGTIFLLRPFILILILLLLPLFLFLSFCVHLHKRSSLRLRSTFYDFNEAKLLSLENASTKVGHGNNVTLILVKGISQRRSFLSSGVPKKDLNCLKEWSQTIMSVIVFVSPTRHFRYSDMFMFFFLFLQYFSCISRFLKFIYLKKEQKKKIPLIEIFLMLRGYSKRDSNRE